MAIARVPIDKIDRLEIVEYKGGCSPKKIQQVYSCDIFINAALFDNKTRNIITNTKTINTGKQGYLFYEYGLGVKDNKPQWTYKWDALKDDSITGFLGSSPSLIINKKIDIQKKDITSSFYGTTTHRSSIGWNDKEIVLCSGGNKYNFPNYAKYVDTLGVDYQINLDGGGSCCLWKDGKQLNSEYDGRLIPCWICIWLKKETDKGDDEMVTKSKVIVNGAEKNCDVIVKDGTTYIKLRDIADSQIVVDYDATKKMPKVDVKK